jgi:hypothetical protein
MTFTILPPLVIHIYDLIYVVTAALRGPSRPILGVFSEQMPF